MKKILILFLCLVVCDSFASGIASNSASAPCTNNTLETYSGNSNLSADWQPNTIQLRWYNEDEKLTVQQSAQSCTYDGTLTIPATPPTRTGYTFAGWEVKHTIPAEYTELEYIESTGRQWIDTGIVPNQDSRMRITVVLTSDAPSARTIGGSYNGSGWADKSFGVYAGGYSGYIYFNYNCDTTISDSNGVMEMLTNMKYVFEINKNLFYINGNSVSSAPATTFTSYESFRIGMVHLPVSGNDRYLTGRVYNFSMWADGTLVRNMIPAKRNSDNVLGMWDTVSKTFFTNQGTGTFIAGPAVQ